MTRLFGLHVHFIGWSQFSLGVSVDLTMPNVELHLPFGFIKIGWRWIFEPEPRVLFTTFGSIEKQNQRGAIWISES